MASLSPVEHVPNGQLDEKGNPIFKPQKEVAYFKAMDGPDGNETKFVCPNCSSANETQTFSWKEAKKVYINNGRYTIKCPGSPNAPCDMVIRPVVEMEEAAWVFHDPEAMRLFKIKYAGKPAIGTPGTEGYVPEVPAGMTHPKKPGERLTLPKPEDLVKA